MTQFRPISNRFQMSFKEKERYLFDKIEEFLMDDMGICTRTDVYKTAAKHLYQERKLRNDLKGVV
tara:strand:+ start:139 stop:333 length:195 start_codon:yes stop_codon:yes gene_type:complete